jgi:hypothetical protein
MKKQKNILQNKIIPIALGALVFLGAGSGTFFYLYSNDIASIRSKESSAISKNVAPTKTATDSTVANKTTSSIDSTDSSSSTSIDSLQSDLNNVNSQTSQLDSEINSASTGISDQETNLTY